MVLRAGLTSWLNLLVTKKSKSTAFYLLKHTSLLTKIGYVKKYD